MENSLEKKQIVDISIRKIFDMKMKQGHEIKKAVVDENEFLRTFFFLKGTKVYVIDISTKKIEEFEFTRGKEVVYISGNVNNEFLIVVFKNGSIYAIDNNHNIKHIKNLNVNSLLYDNKESNGPNFDHFKIFSSYNLNKLIIANDNFITIWYRSDLVTSGSLINYSNKHIIKKTPIEELSGTFYNISIENEKKMLLDCDLSKLNLFENISAIFGNNYFLGSYARIAYVILVPTDTPNLFKVLMINYLFRFESGITNKYEENKNNLNNNEYVKNIEKKTVYSYLTYSNEMSKENLQYNQNKERIIIKFSTSGNCCAIMLNCQHSIYSTLLICMAETQKFSMFKMFDLFLKVKAPKNESYKRYLWVEDLDWICNDMFLVVVLSQGYFLILNINFQLISFIDTSKSLISQVDSLNYINCPNFMYTQNLKLTEKLQILTSKKRTDYFIIYNSNYCICFQANFKSFENRIMNLNNGNETFGDFIFILKYFQLYYNENENLGLFDSIHNYMVKCLKELYNPDGDHSMPNEHISHTFSIFVKFLRIFRSINQIHDTNLTILSYLIGVSNDFFYHLINFKEIWLAFLFIDMCETYLLKNLRLKISRNKLNDEQIKKNQISYIALNPYHQQNPSLKCYNKIINKVLHSRLRLILLFFALIEFRNNQALNINVLYFVLAKLCLEKLKKNNMLDDVKLIVKVIIRNWKYLKNENARAGSEEYILNGLTINMKTEILSQFLPTKMTRDDIKFEFFGDFFPLDGLQDFTDLHETYCRGDEESLVNEYNYINNIGIIQRWILFFSNFFYNFLFEDIRNYISNNLKQTKKEAENISPEEMNLTHLIYFNLNFFLLCLNNHIRFFLKFMTRKSEDSNNEFNSVSDDSKILSEFNNIFMPFISPVNVPFIIFEFYSTEDNKLNKNLPYEINTNLNNLIVNSLKSYNFSVSDTLDFLEFLNENGFRNYYDSENFNSEEFEDNKNINKFQKIIYSAFIFYLFTIHKLNHIHSLELDLEMILSVIDNMQINLKAECYELLFVILNGYLKFFLNKESKGKLNQNNSKYLEIVINLIKTIYYKILREEPFYFRRKIYEYVHVTSQVMKSYLLEGALFYEYKNLNKYIKKKLFDSKSILNINNFLMNSFRKIPNLFEEFTKKTQNPIFDFIFPNDESKISYDNFSNSMKNIILLTKTNSNEKSSPKLIFAIESNTDYIKKIILNGFGDKMREKSENEVVLSIIDKIIKGNFDNKNVFKFYNNELKSKLIKSIKLALIKTLHIFNLILLKHKSFYQLNPHKETLQYLKLISYSLLFNNEDSNKDDIQTCDKIMDNLTYYNYRQFRDNDKSILIEIVKNIYLLFTKLKRNISENKKIQNLEDKIKLENKEIHTKLRSILEDEIPKIKFAHDRMNFIKSNNLKSFFILSFTDFYWENMTNLFTQWESFAISQNTKNPLRNAKKIYIKLSESFSDLTGVPIKNQIDFNENWELSNNEELFNFILSDDFEDRFTEVDKNTEILMNRRQRNGQDTPRRRSINIRLPRNINVVNNNLNYNSISKDVFNTSIDVREENEISNEIKNINNQIKIKGKKQKANLPKYRKESINKIIKYEKIEDNQSVSTVVKKSFNDLQDDISVSTIVNKNELKNQENYVKSFINKISKVFFTRFKSNLFYKYREEIKKKELEEIKIYNIKPKENSVEVITLKEKYVANKEFDSKNNLNSSYISETKKGTGRSSKNPNNFSISRDLNSSYIGDNSLSDLNRDGFNIKPFDIINLNKFNPGKAEDSEIYKNLIANKNKKIIQSTIKSKIEEIQEKLRKYEEMAINLNKEFNVAFNK